MDSTPHKSRLRDLREGAANDDPLCQNPFPNWTKVRVDHDISLLVPEIWCRMSPEERNPRFLIAGRYLGKCEDFEHAGKKVLAGRLGYRINARFVHSFFARKGNHPDAGAHRRYAAPGTSGPRHLCGRHGQHRFHAKARRENVF